ncbi:MAG: enoyl-CoA hydratase/isomerase family protein [Pseudomonadota bacterium]
MTENHEPHADGVVTIILDTEGDINVISDAAMAGFEERLTAALSDDAVKGIIIASAKRDFLAGGDLDVLYKACTEAAAAKPEEKSEHAQKIYDQIMPLQHLLRRMETSGKPVVAIMEGAALGGGFELCLACHHRIAVNTPSVSIGLPEVLLGLMPNAGGTQRLPRLIGAQKALPLLMDGVKLDAGAAADLGLVDLAASAEDAFSQARTWIAAHQPAVQPWDARGFRPPGGKPNDLSAMQTFAFANITLRRDWYGASPARKAILRAVYEGLHITLDEALPVEAAFFAELAFNPLTVSNLDVTAATPARLRRSARAGTAPALEINPAGPLGAELRKRAKERGLTFGITKEEGVALIVKDGAPYRLYDTIKDGLGAHDAIGRLYQTDAGFAVAEVGYGKTAPGPVLAALAHLGVAPVAARRTEGQSFTERLTAALSRRTETLAAEGASAHMLHRARRAAGLRGAETADTLKTANATDASNLSVSAMAAELRAAITSEIQRAVANQDIAELSQARLLAVLGCGAPPTIAAAL